MLSIGGIWLIGGTVTGPLPRGITINFLHTDSEEHINTHTHTHTRLTALLWAIVRLL